MQDTNSYQTNIQHIAEKGCEFKKVLFQCVETNEFTADVHGDLSEYSNKQQGSSHMIRTAENDSFEVIVNDYPAIESLTITLFNQFKAQLILMRLNGPMSINWTAIRKLIE
ncbi:hypothetical protein [Erysipelothrix anatis]|uniref:hypothetical protein n=1 Tax=Erysipelothrix anatis TaxID=2683713 RepID=UPI00135750BB|nr:hypothetical protein [Erysipelothrix anatis]